MCAYERRKKNKQTKKEVQTLYLCRVDQNLLFIFSNCNDNVFFQSGFEFEQKKKCATIKRSLEEKKNLIIER